MRSLAFSHMNHLYMLAHSGNIRVYSTASGDHNQAAIMAISLHGDVHQIILASNDLQIVIQMLADNLTDKYEIEVWSLRRSLDTDDDSAPHPNTIPDIDLSGDASQLAIGTGMGIEVWDAQVGQHHWVFQSQFNHHS